MGNVRTESTHLTKARHTASPAIASSLSRGLSGFLTMLALSVMLLPVGCTTAAKQAFSEIRGARGKLLLNREVPANALREFRSVRFSPATTTLGPLLCDPQVPGIYNRYATQTEQNLRRAFPGGQPQLAIGSEILYVRTKDLLNHAQFLVRLKMRGGGRLVVDAVLNVQSKAFRDGDEDAMAEAAFEAIEEFLLEQKGDPAEMQAEQK